MNAPLRPAPERVEPGVVLIDVYDLRIDEFGRVRFFAYWADDNRWRGGNGKWSAQVFHAGLREFVERHARRGESVEVMWP